MCVIGVVYRREETLKSIEGLLFSLFVGVRKRIFSIPLAFSFIKKKSFFILSSFLVRQSVLFREKINAIRICDFELNAVCIFIFCYFKSGFFSSSSYTYIFFICNISMLFHSLLSILKWMKNRKKNRQFHCLQTLNICVRIHSILESFPSLIHTFIIQSVSQSVILI